MSDLTPDPLWDGQGSDPELERLERLLSPLKTTQSLPPLPARHLPSWVWALAAGLVLVDVTPRMEPEGVQRIVDFMTHRPEGFESLEEAADAIARYREHRSRPRDLSGLAKNLRKGEDGRWRWHWDPAFIRGAGSVRASEAHEPRRLLAAAERLTIPTLLVRGRESDVVSLEGAAEFQQAVPHAKFADVSGAGHMVAGDRNDAFSEAVIAFLDDLSP